MEQQEGIVIQRIGTKTIRISIVGTSPLIVHRFTEKSKKQMLDAMQGKKNQKENKDPEKEWKDALYLLKDGGYGFPAIGFKAASVGAARFYGKDVKMSELRQFLFFNGETGVDGQKMVRIIGEPVMREDAVKVGMGGTDLRYRPMFPEWEAVLEVVYVENKLTLDSVVSIIAAGGLGVGVGEWRPQKNGDFGTYEIDASKKIEVIA